MVELSLDVARFRFQCSGASWVYVAGDFNGWSTTATPMRQVRRGVWQAEVRLAPGDYRFRYFTSHRGWLTDWAAFGVERNPFGDWDSVLHVPEHREAGLFSAYPASALVPPAPAHPLIASTSIPGPAWDSDEEPDDSILAPQSLALSA